MVCDRESILVVTQYFPPETGAASSRWDELSKRWANEASVTVLTSVPDYPEGDLYDGFDNGWVRRAKRGDVNVIYTKTITSPSGNLRRRSLKFVWFMLISLIVGLSYTSPTTVIATSPQPLTGVSAWIISRMKRATFIFEVRDLWPESILAVSNFDNRLLIWALNGTITFLYRRADRIVVVSKGFIEPIVERNVDRSKLAFHPNGVDLDFYERAGDPPDVMEQVDEGFTISYVGTIGRAHGLSIVLDAAPSLTDAQFLMVGDGAERETLEEQSRELENVTFTGRLPKRDIPYVLQESDAALVHLKPRDIFETVIPSKLLEAMAASLPVVLGVHGEAERIVTDADAGIVIEPGDSEELINAIDRLRTDAGKGKRLGTNGREYVRTHFEWRTISEDYLAMIESAGK